MSLDDQKDLSRRAILLWASDNTDTAEDIVAQSYINHQEPYAKGGVGDLSLEAWKDLAPFIHRTTEFLAGRAGSAGLTAAC